MPPPPPPPPSRTTEHIELLFSSWDTDGDGKLELWELADEIADQQDDFREVVRRC